MRRWTAPIILILILLLFPPILLVAQNNGEQLYIVQPGDTWTALSFRTGDSPEELMEYAGSINPQRQPIIGSTILLHEFSEMNGHLLRPFTGGLLETAARNGRSPWELSLQNRLGHPNRPLLYTPVFLPGGSDVPKEMPDGFESLALSTLLARPGQALAVYAQSQSRLETIIGLDSHIWSTFRNGDRLLSIGATGAFFGAGTPELLIQVEQRPLWVQPWLFEDLDWFYDKVVFAPTAANEQEALLLERERLQQIWEQVTLEPLWSTSFKWPLQEYVEITSHYGARRSVNGGSYDTYHEGTDFSAYRGTPVFAPAGGRVVLAESLIVRGNAVILDHGIGIHTGYYHLSSINVHPGDEVDAEDLLGEVGTTGRSTGNHLHWDLLIGNTWVDAESWMDSDLSDWIRDAWAGALFEP